MPTFGWPETSEVDWQATFAFSAPVTLTVRYDDAGASSLREETLNLYRWNEGSGWQPAQDTCPEGARDFRLDPAANTVVARVCKLSEFALMGIAQRKVYLPLVFKNYPLPLRINLDPKPERLPGETESAGR